MQWLTICTRTGHSRDAGFIDREVYGIRHGNSTPRCTTAAAVVAED